MFYTAREGERLDLIAYKFYGDAKKIDLLLRENRIAKPFTGAGEVLEVPKEVETETYKPVEVPLWLKNS